MKIGDKVRFLSEVGGGVITAFQGKEIALVEDADGFEIPMLIKELVVVQTDEYNRPQDLKQPSNTQEAEEIDPADREITYRQPEIKGNDVLNLYLAFVPQDEKKPVSTDFDAYLVNDSNYFIDYLILTPNGNEWTLKSRGTIRPNRKEHLDEVLRTSLNDWSKLCFQGIAYKDNKSFALKPPIQQTLRIDAVKFYKAHAFIPSQFFPIPSLLFTIIEQDEAKTPVTLNEQIFKPVPSSSSPTEKKQPDYASYEKINTNGVIEVDLHIHELLDDTSGMDNAAMLTYQLKTFGEIMEKHLTKKGTRIVFIHGKGDGVLRQSILQELKRKYPRCQSQDASFREYGFGATMVIIR